VLKIVCTRMASAVFLKHDIVSFKSRFGDVFLHSAFKPSHGRARRSGDCARNRTAGLPIFIAIQPRIYYEPRGKRYRLPFKNLEGGGTSINTGV